MLAVITENQLDNWVRGNAREAQKLIVNLVYRLVAASCPNPLERRFPLGDSIGQHGSDGILNVDSGYAPFVPDGRSYWEIGTGGKTGKEVLAKATSDYNDLTEALQENMQEDIREDSTFVFVTPRSGVSAWKEQDQAVWLEERRKTGEWKDVQVLDGTKLIDWLHYFPTVGIWLAGRIHGPQLDHIEIPERHWEVVSSFGAPPVLTPDLFLANRGNACEKLQKLFDEKSGQLKLITRFPSQAVDFVCAYLTSLDEELGVDVAGRCLIISDTQAWNTICNQYREDSFVLIAAPSLNLCGDTGSEAIQRAANAGHAVVFDAPYGGPSDDRSSEDSCVILQNPRAHQIKDALVAAGHPEQRAHTFSYRCDRDLNSLLRLLDGHSLPPEWATGSGGPDLACALLAGSWEHSSEADRAVIRELTEKEYRDWNNALNEIAVVRNPPIIRIDGFWKFVSRYEGWYALVDKLDEDHLDKFREIAVWVLRENGPQFDPSPEELLQADRKGRTFILSPYLRKGIAESLALIGGHSKAFPSHIRYIAIHTADRAVYEIFANADWETWASLDRLLPLLAEASPHEFLKAVREALDRTPCPFDQLFPPEVEGLFGRNYLVGLLWALETLAWDTKFLIEVCLLLGKLDRLDPGGSHGNRPISSLIRILHPLVRQTTASVQIKIDAMMKLQAQTPATAWKLLRSVLPNKGGTIHSNHRPSWRDTIPDDWEPGVTPWREIEKQVETYGDMIADVACNNFERLKDKDLIGKLKNLPQSAFNRILDHLSSEAVLSQPEDQRIELWAALTRCARWHKGFPNAKWALSEEEVSTIEKITEQLAPRNASAVHRLLFSNDCSLLFEETEDGDEMSQRLSDSRRRAISEIVSSDGIDAVIQLAQDVEFPKEVGHVLAAIADSETDGKLLPQMLETETEKLTLFAKGYVHDRRHRSGWAWIDSLNISNWTPAQIGEFLSWLPFTEEVWKRAEAWLGEREGEYWRRTGAGLRYGTKGDIGWAIDKLIEHRRPNDAIRCLALLRHDRGTFDKQQAIRALLSPGNLGEPVDQDLRYAITEIIKNLQSDPEVNSEDLIKVEWAYLSILERHFGASPKTLEYALASDPDSYCQAIQLIYRPEGQDAQSRQLSEQEKALAQSAYSLLFEWETIPGTQSDGTFSPKAFTEWLNHVKAVCGESGHLGIALEQVGEVLAHYPPDPDGLWIHPTIAKALDGEDSEAMRDGFKIGISNSRGFHVVDGTGKEERDLAAENRRKADEIENAGYHRLAQTFRAIAERYDNESDDAITSDAQMD